MTALRRDKMDLPANENNVYAITISSCFNLSTHSLSRSTLQPVPMYLCLSQDHNPTRSNIPSSLVHRSKPDNTPDLCTIGKPTNFDPSSAISSSKSKSG
ncbi:hypothetical protein BT63DRAFT_201730 [Microthyrium microscopicum]|uniref:Uncharacterized protein n=1 Tax=Microthyrium microscopicum TaxID=703497 RepID=A0A6A6UG63_9PEZI|nr:hypothetical protein BT63DRAFT_201730 [Microthyrium microscopicum]